MPGVTMDQLPPNLISEYLTACWQTRELATSVTHYATEVALHSLGHIFTGDLSPTQQRSCLPSVEVNDEMYLLSQLVLQSHSPAVREASPTSTSGRQAVQHIQDVVFGQQCSGSSLLELVRSTTVLQAHQARDMLVAVLMMSLSPANCMSIYAASSSCHAANLALSARTCALQSLSQALRDDQKGFVALGMTELESLLQDDDLVIPSESEVFHAIAMWVDARPGERAGLFAPLVSRCVRYRQMGLRELEALDQHPLVVGSSEATRLVAGMYLSHIMGGPSNGSQASTQPRTCQRQQQGSCQAAAAECGAPGSLAAFLQAMVY